MYLEKLKNCKPEEIRKLHKIGAKLEKVTVTIPSSEEQEEARKIIEGILPPEEGIVYMPYVWTVLFALEYMEKKGLKPDDFDV